MVKVLSNEAGKILRVITFESRTDSSPPFMSLIFKILIYIASWRFTTDCSFLHFSYCLLFLGSQDIYRAPLSVVHGTLGCDLVPGYNRFHLLILIRPDVLFCSQGECWVRFCSVSLWSRPRTVGSCWAIKHWGRKRFGRRSWQAKKALKITLYFCFQI